MEVMKKVLSNFSWLMCDSGTSVTVSKKLVQVSSQLYPLLLAWASQRSKDHQVEQCWERFASIKGQIMQQLDSDNEG
jgi:hypothetical protein